jgi:hypothetical protein
MAGLLSLFDRFLIPKVGPSPDLGVFRHRLLKSRKCFFGGASPHRKTSGQGIPSVLHRRDDGLIIPLRKARKSATFVSRAAATSGGVSTVAGPAVEREFGRLKHNYGLAFLRVRGSERVRLHADLTMLGRLALELAKARAVPLAA